MPTLQELRDTRAGIWAQAQEFNERHGKGDTMSAEDETAWQRALDEVDDLGAKIENRERTESLGKRFDEIDEEQDDKRRSAGSPAGGDGAALEDEYRAAFDGFMRFGLNDIEPEQRKLLRANFSQDKAIRAQGVSTGAGGGYTVPEAFWSKVTETMKWFGGMLESGVEVIDTDNGQHIPWSTNDDTGNKGRLLGEGQPIVEKAIAFGGKTLSAYMYTSDLVLVSLQLLQDSGIDIEGRVAIKLGERLGRIFNEHWSTGDAANKPQGLITGATVGKTTAGATAIIVDEIIDLIHSVDRAYRSGPGVGFQLHDLVLAYVRKIRDDSGGAGLGRPIWEPSIQVGQPDTLFGYAVNVNNDMASTVATTNKTMAFGSFRAAYVARRVNNAMLMRLAERYAEFLQVGFFGFQRMDGIVQDASAVKVLQQL